MMETFNLDISQTQSMFQKSLQNVVFKMERSKYQQGSLKIQLFFQKIRGQYSLEITQDMISNDQILSKCFEKPQDIYEEIVENFKEVSIQDDGTISFDMKIGKKKKVKVILKANFKQKIIEQISIVKDNIMNMILNEKKGQQKIEQLKQSAFKIQHDVQENSKKVKQTLQEISELKKLLFVQDTERNILKCKVQNFQEYHKSMSKKQNKKNCENKIKMKKSKENCQNNNSDSNEYFSISAFINQQITNKPLKTNLQLIEPEAITISKLQPTKKHQGNTHFQLLQNNSILRRKTIYPYWHNFISNAMLKSGSIYIITIQIVKTLQGSILIGIISKDMFNSHNTRGSELSISLDLQNPGIWANKVQVDQCDTEQFEAGDCVRMVVNLFKNKVEWFKKVKNEAQYELIGEIHIPKQLQQKFLYSTITLRHYDDTIRILS